MNEAAVRHPRPTTRAADGLPRWSWSVRRSSACRRADIFATKTGSNWWAGRSCRCHRKGAVTRSSAWRSHSAFRGRRLKASSWRRSRNSTSRKTPMRCPTCSFVPPPSRRRTSAARTRCSSSRSQTRASPMTAGRKRGFSPLTGCANTGSSMPQRSSQRCTPCRRRGIRRDQRNWPRPLLADPRPGVCDLARDDRPRLNRALRLRTRCRGSAR